VELAEAIRRRRMVRRYDPERPVPDEARDAVLDAMLRAPSAGHTQAVAFLLWSEPEDRSAFWSCAAPPSASARESTWLRGMRTAPLLVSIWVSRQAYLDRYSEPDKGWSDRDPERWSAPYWYVDAGMAAYAGLITAVDRGLGACFFGLPPERQAAVRERFGVPADQLSVGLLSLGYTVESGERQGSAARRRRRPREERVFRGTWTRR
jgi:nitroreductase